MRINFILPDLGLSGGAKAVLEFANHLHSRGHAVGVVYPLIPMDSLIKGRSRPIKIVSRFCGALNNLRKRKAVDWFDLKADLIRVTTLQSRFVPDADFVFATWWETAHYVHSYTAEKGKKFYLVQHFETWGGRHDRVIDSYRLGLRMVVNSQWVAQKLKEAAEVKPEALILHAPDRRDFYPEPKTARDDRPVRVLMAYRPEDWKGIADGIRAFEVVSKKFPDVRLVMFGMMRPANVPAYAEFHHKPTNAQLRGLYNSCDIFVFPSWCEGFGMPPMEAMACQCAVVTTNVGAVPDFAVAKETALISEPRDIGSLANNIIRLIEDRDERMRIALNGYTHISQFTWERAAEQLEKVLLQNLR